VDCMAKLNRSHAEGFSCWAVSRTEGNVYCSQLEVTEWRVRCEYQASSARVWSDVGNRE
jgi:hypothetical protein